MTEEIAKFDAYSRYTDATVRNTSEVGIVNVVRTESKGKAFKRVRIVLAGV